MAVAFSPTLSTSVNSIYGHFWDGEIMYVPGDPGDTYNQGDILTAGTAGEGHVDACAAGELPYCVVAPGVPQIVCPSGADVKFPLWRGGSADPAKILTDTMRTLIPVIPWVSRGTRVQKVRFEDYQTDDVISYTSGASNNLALTTGLGADDRPNGAIAYIYSGAGKGEWNLVSDYDHTGGAVELMVNFHRDWNSTPDSTSDILFLSGEAAANAGIGFFGRTVVEDSGNVEVDDGYNDGELVVFADARTLAYELERGVLPLVKATSFGLLA